MISNSAKSCWWTNMKKAPRKIFWNCLHFPLMSNLSFCELFPLSSLSFFVDCLELFFFFLLFLRLQEPLLGRMFWVVDVSSSLFFSEKRTTAKFAFTHVVTLKSLKWIKFWWTWELWAFYRVFLAWHEFFWWLKSIPYFGKTLL